MIRTTSAAAASTLLLIACLAAAPLTDRAATPGPVGPVGPRGEPRRVVRTLLIDKPGVYEDYLVDAAFADADAVRITADGVTLRNCEIRNGRRDGVEVYAKDVLIENCRIHHFLGGTFADPKDAHGITGRPTRLTVRNCEIGFVSGDCLQFDPGRGAWGDVAIENCRLYAAPLPADAAGFKRGERPGENGLDTKQRAANARSRIVVRDSVIHGFANGGQIRNAAALNLKDHVEAAVERCVFYDNEIALRLRGPGGGGGGGGDAARGGASVTAIDCAFDDVDVAIRTEDGLERARVVRPQFGPGVRQRHRHAGRPAVDFQISDERPATPINKFDPPAPP